MLQNGNFAKLFVCFFQRGDDIAIHTIAGAAYQILIDICKIKKIQRELEDSWILEELGVKQKVLAATREPQNFFKHADKDPEGTIKYHPLLSACLIMYGIQYFFSLTGERFSEGQVFRIWFFLRFPDSLPPEVKDLLSNIPEGVNPDDYNIFLDMINWFESKQPGPIGEAFI